MEPTSTRERERLCREFEADCVTKVNEPSNFAQELGAAFAAGTSWSNVELNASGEIVRQLRPPEIGDRVVWMYHGPVLYCDAAEQLVDSFPVIHRSAAVSFIKRGRFSGQKEYRFKVAMNGTPKDTQLLLPISPSLKGLAKIE